LEEIESWSKLDMLEATDEESAGRLLTWVNFLSFIESATPVDFSIRPAFVSYVQNCNAIASVLNLTVYDNDAISREKGNGDPLPLEVSSVFDEYSVNLTKLCALAFFRTIETFPSPSKRWWEEDCPKAYANEVQGFLEKKVSPEILKRELERIRNTDIFGDMRVSASSKTREVTANYIQDDFTLTVVITLPSAFPLRSVEVDCSKTFGIPQNRWKRWSLQITMMLNNQGGTLKEALMLWKENVDKEFEGVEPCPICYSIVHVKTHKIPTLECKTCHNRFHVNCMTQWFQSSGKNNCVMCQQPWAGTRIQ
jgi:hypothetical protein